MEDNTNIIIEDDIVNAVSFNRGISGTTDVLVDAENLFVNISLKKTNFHIRTVERETCPRGYQPWQPIKHTATSPRS